MPRYAHSATTWTWRCSQAYLRSASLPPLPQHSCAAAQFARCSVGWGACAGHACRFQQVVQLACTGCSNRSIASRRQNTKRQVMVSEKTQKSTRVSHQKALRSTGGGVCDSWRTCCLWLAPCGLQGRWHQLPPLPAPQLPRRVPSSPAHFILGGRIVREGGNQLGHDARRHDDSKPVPLGCSI